MTRVEADPNALQTVNIEEQASVPNLTSPSFLVRHEASILIELCQYLVLVSQHSPRPRKGPALACMLPRCSFRVLPWKLIRRYLLMPITGRLHHIGTLSPTAGSCCRWFFTALALLLFFEPVP